MANQNAFATYMRLLSYLKPLMLPFTVSIVGFLFFAATQPGLAKIMALVIDAITQQGGTTDISLPFTTSTISVANHIFLPLLAVTVYIFRGIGSFFGSYYNAYVSQKVVLALRVDIFNHLTTLPPAFFDKQSTGEILQRLTGSVMLVSQAASNAFKVIIREGLTVIFLIIYAFYTNWKVSLIFLIVAPCLTLTVRYTTRMFRTIAQKSEGVMATVLQSANEMIVGHETMRAFTAEEYEKARYRKAVDGTFKLAMKITKVSAIATPVIQLIIAVALACIIYMILQPSTLAEYTAGELVGYLTTIALLPKPMRQLSEVNVIIQRGIIAAEIIFDTLDVEKEQDDGTFETEYIKGHIQFRNVNFSYDDKHNVIEGFSLEVKPGQNLALIGRSGSGKSTLVGLLPRHRRITQGSITIDNTNVDDFTLKNLRQHIALVNQKVILFNDTVRNNIAYGSMTNASEKEIILAAQRAYAWKFIQELPNGLDTKIGENGQRLSGGQRQRLAIARVFLKDSPILILDEATSALDNESEYIIQQALDDVSVGRTTIVIAHRLTTVENADKIVIIDKGKIIGQGTHKELLDSNELYNNMYNMDFAT